MNHLTPDFALRAVRRSLVAKCLPYPVRVKRVAPGTLAFEVCHAFPDGSGIRERHAWEFADPADLVTLSPEYGEALEAAVSHANRCSHLGIRLHR